MLARLGSVLLFESGDALAEFVARVPTDHCFASLPEWTSIEGLHLREDVDEFDFDEDGIWLFDSPSTWNSPRRAEVVDRLNLFWDAANQFGDLTSVEHLRGGGRGAVLGQLADALMESNEAVLRELRASDVRLAYREQSRVLFAQCRWTTP